MSTVGRGRKSSIEKNVEGDWANLSSQELKADHSEFLLSTEPGSNSLRLPIGARGDITHGLLPRGEPQCAAVIWFLARATLGVKWKHLFREVEVSLLLFVSLWSQPLFPFPGYNLNSFFDTVAAFSKLWAQFQRRQLLRNVKPNYSCV